MKQMRVCFWLVGCSVFSVVKSIRLKFIICKIVSVPSVEQIEKNYLPNVLMNFIICKYIANLIALSLDCIKQMFTNVSSMIIFFYLIFLERFLTKCFILKFEIF